MRTAFFGRSSEFTALYGQTTNEQFVDLVYENVLGREADAEGKAYWLTLDVKGPAILVWLVGYKEKGSTAFGSENGAFQDVLKEGLTKKPVEKKRGHDPLIHKYVWKGQMTAGGSREWKTYSRRKMPFRPTMSGGQPNGVKFEHEHVSH